MEVLAMFAALMFLALAATIPLALAARWIVRRMIRQRMAEGILREVLAREIAHAGSRDARRRPAG